MNEFLGAYMPVIVVGLLAGLVVGFMMFRPKHAKRDIDTQGSPE